MCAAPPGPTALGADVERLDRLAGELAAGAVDLGRRAARWGRTPAGPSGPLWTGPDARRADAAAAGLVRGLVRAASALDALAGECRRAAAAQRRAAAPAPRVSVERLDVRGDGRLVRRVGDVGAPVVVALVPGVGSDRGDADALLSDAVRVHAVASVGHGRDDVAVVSWLGYDAPDHVAGGIDPRPAAAGSVALRRDVARWRSGGASTVAVVGHSYGALVAGRAAATGGRSPSEPDVLVQLGAPGAGPPGPSAWRRLLDEGPVWAAARAQGDPIALAAAVALPVHGPDPVLLTRRLPTSLRGHGGYLRDPLVLDAVVALVPSAGGSGTDRAVRSRAGR